MMKQDRNRKTAIRIGMAVSVVIVVIGIAGIVSYFVQLKRVKQTTQEIREAAEDNSELGNQDSELQAVEGTSVPEFTEVPELTEVHEVTPVAEEVRTAAANENLLLPVDYPDGLQVNERIRKARKKSQYVMGWLKMDDLDEPVAQKDNNFFLDHDAAGLHNINGAIFMDENTKLLTRPYTVFLYGHNMKSGAMFGNLRKYRKAEYCQTHRDISFETLYEADGVGLAAPQVGILKRIVVIDIGEGPLVFVNPVITMTDGEQCGSEGCLSVPGKAGMVTRPNYVKVEAYDENMEKFELEGTELLARAICHECDHLDGKLYVDLVEGELADVSEEEE